MSKWTTADSPGQRGRTAIVTGANAGLGFEIADALAASGAHVVIATSLVAGPWPTRTLGLIAQ